MRPGDGNQAFVDLPKRDDLQICIITFWATSRHLLSSINNQPLKTMGAWDATSFGNDTANDWAYDLEECNDFSHIEATLQKVLDTGDDYLDSDAAVEGIAAAEVLAWLRGRPTPVNAYTEKIASWVAAHPIQPPPAMLQKALSVLDRIQRQPSELPELWEGDPDWTASMADLHKRLTT